ncbi:benzoate 1,2-dioxygenase [Klebsiella pneumoniae subsp. pneumoniae]|nr:benzoate 1,2-dioxygenase [Klebsiella pneumoniae subsp. pneumoniae]
MSNLSPDFTLPINFCANPQDAWTIPARFYTDSQAFEHEKERIFANSWIASPTAARSPGRTITLPGRSSAKISLSSAAATTFCAPSITSAHTAATSY